MLEQALEKKHYTELKNRLLCNPEEFKTELPDFLGRFDYVTASGLLAEGHATNHIFTEMDMVLKKGGYAIFTSREEYLTSLGYQEGMDEMVSSGKWEKISQTTYEKYSNAPKSSVGRFKPTISAVHVYRKI